MTAKLWVVACSMLLAGGLCPSAGVRADGFADGVARVLCPQISRWEHELAESRQALNQLKHVVARDLGEQLGFHSELLDDPDVSVSIVLNLGRPRPVDMVVLTPALSTALAAAGGSESPLSEYAFPQRYRVDAALQQDFSDAVVLLDRSDQDPSSPGGVVLIEQVKQKRPLTQFVRLTVTRHSPLGADAWGFALSEMMAFAQGRNVALNCSVAAEHSLEEDRWRSDYLVDGVAPWGKPMTNESSPTRGFRLEKLPSGDEPVWVEVDLGEPQVIAEVTLMGAQPVGWPSGEGYGFPEVGRIEIRQNPQDAAPHVIRFSSQPQPGALCSSSGHHELNAAAGDVVGRYVRIVAEELEPRPHTTADGFYVFALSEIAVLTPEGSDAALGKTVTTSHADMVAPATGPWSLANLVDGYDSQQRLGRWEPWLRDVKRRSELDLRWRRASEQLEQAEQSALARLATLILGSAALAPMVLIGGLLWHYRRKARELEAIRRQIANDLHDDVGANLAAIGMVAQAACQSPEAPESLREDLVEINRVAGETADTMRDIVWLIETEHNSLRDLIQRMETLADALLCGMDHETLVQLQTQRPERPLPHSLRRHILLAWKEALTNVVRHAQATSVLGTIFVDEQRLKFQVTDNGRGLTRPTDDGRGLKNLRQRARELGGEVTVTGEPGEGVSVEFQAPLA